MHTPHSTSHAAERLAALIDLAREHDDDLNYAEVEQLMSATRPRLVLRERTQPAQPSRTRAYEAGPS